MFFFLLLVDVTTDIIDTVTSRPTCSHVTCRLT